MPRSPVRFICRVTASCLWLLGLISPPGNAQLLVPRLVRQFDPKRGMSLTALGMTQDKNGRLWMATTNGVVRFDGGQFQVFHDPVLKGGDFYYHLTPSPDGRIWLKMGSGVSLSYLDTRTPRIVRIADTTRLIREYLAKYGSHSIFADAKATLWIGLQQHGLLKVNPYTLAIEHIIDQGLDVRFITQDRRGIIYFTTSNQGFFAYNPQTGALTNYRHDDRSPASVGSNTLYGVQARPDGSILVSLNRGTDVFWPATGTFQHLGLNMPRLIDPQNHAYSAEFKLDAQGNAYFNTGDILFRYTAQGVLQRVGLQTPTHGTASLHVSPTNQLWVSSAEKLYEYDLNQAPTRSSLLFLSLTINGTELADNTSATQNLVYDAQGHPTLTVPEDAPFTMQFTLAAQLEAGTLRWRLDGYNQQWLVSQSPQGESTYQLPAGTYILTVNQGFRGGTWKPTVSTMTIVVVAPFWKRPAFLTLVILVVVGLGYYVVRTYIRRRQLAQQLDREQQQAASLRQLDEFKTRFFSNVTHEFRTPLTIILNATEQLTAKTPAHAEQPEVATIRRHAHQLLRLITQTLDMARLDAGKLDTHLQLGNPVGFTGQVVAQFAGLAAQRGLTLTYNTQPALAWLYTDNDLVDGAPTGGPQQYSFDGEAWEKIAYNLLANALKFTPRGGSVQVTGQVQADNRFLLVVEDTGIGIPADQIARIFDRFHQVDDRSTRAYSGTGIGLALVQELASWLGGQIRVESQLDQGSRFTVELPLLRPDQASSPVTAEEAKISEGSTAPVHPPWSQPMAKPSSAHLPGHRGATAAMAADKPLVLVVEDNDDLRTQMAAYLSGDYQVLTAQNGQWGWEEATSQVPDVIVSDVMMPQLDGYQLLERLKTDERTSHIPVILLTARSSAESRLQGLQLRADDYLIKPVSLVELGLRIGNGLRTRQQAQKRLLAQLNLPPSPLPTESAPSREELFLNRLRQAILTHLASESLDVDWLAAQAHLSRTQLNRKLSALTGLSPNRFIQRVRLERGAELLRSGTLTVTEIAYQIGYDSPSYFAKVFQEHFGYPPSKWRDQ